MNQSKYMEQNPRRRTFFKNLTEERVVWMRALLLRGIRVGLPMLLMSLILVFWQYPYFWVAALFGVSPEEAYYAISNGTGQQILQILLSSFAFLVPFGLAARVKERPLRKVIPFCRPKGRVAPLFWMALGLCAFADIAVSMAGRFFESFGVSYEVTGLKEPPGLGGFLLLAFASAVVPAFVEEFACRGAVYGLLEPFGEGFAVVASAALFGVMHGNFEQMPFAFLVGLALGFVRAKTGSLWICVLIHFTNNFFATIQGQMRYYFPAQVQQLTFVVFLVISLVGAVLALWAVRDETANFFRFKTAPSVLSTAEKTTILVLSPTVVVFIGICLWESILYFK